MRGEMVFYMSLDEGRQLVNELDFFFRRVYGEDLVQSHRQITSQVPAVLGLLLQLAQFMPNAVDLTQYLPRK